MSDPVLDIESSEQDCSPRELFEIVHGTTTYRFTSATRDISYGGYLYTAIPTARSESGVTQSGNTKEMTVILPVDHAFARRYFASPPSVVQLTIRRQLAPSGDTETLFEGDIESVSVDDNGTEATFRCEAKLGRGLLRVIPTVTAERECVHMVYDTMCKIDREGTNPDGKPYKLTTTVLYVNGRDVRIDLSSIPADYTYRPDWLVNGELLHVASGERMAIADQKDANPGISTVTVISMQATLYGLKVGDTVDVFAGCFWNTTICRGRFGNMLNYGGLPQLPIKNPFVYVSYGVGDSI